MSLSRWLDSSIGTSVRIAWSWFVIVGVWNVSTPQNISRSRDFFYVTRVGGGCVGLVLLSLSSVGLVVLRESSSLFRAHVVVFHNRRLIDSDSGKAQWLVAGSTDQDNQD